MDTHTNTQEVNSIRAVTFKHHSFTLQDGTKVYEDRRYQIGFTNDVKIDGKVLPVITQVIEAHDLGDGRTKVRLFVSIADKKGPDAKPINNRIAQWLEMNVDGRIDIEHDLSMLVALGGGAR